MHKYSHKLPLIKWYMSTQTQFCERAVKDSLFRIVSLLLRDEHKLLIDIMKGLNVDRTLFFLFQLFQKIILQRTNICYIYLTYRQLTPSTFNIILFLTRKYPSHFLPLYLSQFNFITTLISYYRLVFNEPIANENQACTDTNTWY